MTLEEALLEVYESTDEQSDLDIYDGGTTVDLSCRGSIRLSGLLQRAQDAISVWKLPTGRRLRFRFMNDNLIAQTVIKTWEVDSGGVYPGFALPLSSSGAPAPVTDSLRGAFCLIDPLLYPVVTNVSGAVSLAKEVEVDPAGEDALFLSRFLIPTVPNSKRMIQVTGVYDIENDTQLERAGDRELGNSVTLAEPSTYKPVAGGIEFDSVYDEVKFYRINFQRWPTMPTTLTGSFELPLAFHDAICEYAKYTANMRIGKAESAQMAWNRVNSILVSLRQEADLEEDLVDRSIQVTGWN